MNTKRISSSCISSGTRRGTHVKNLLINRIFSYHSRSFFLDHLSNLIFSMKMIKACLKEIIDNVFCFKDGRQRYIFSFVSRIRCCQANFLKPPRFPWEENVPIIFSCITMKLGIYEQTEVKAFSLKSRYIDHVLLIDIIPNNLR